MITITIVEMEQMKEKNAKVNIKLVHQPNSLVRTLNVFAKRIDVMAKMIVEIIRMNSIVRVSTSFIIYQISVTKYIRL